MLISRTLPPIWRRIRGITARGGRENRSLSRRPVRHDSQAGRSEWEQVITPEHSRGSPPRKRAVLLALGYYGRQMARLRRFAVPAMLLPALGNTCIFYIAPLIVAHLVGHGRSKIMM